MILKSKKKEFTMFNFMKQKKEQSKISPIELSINETLENFSFLFTAHCFNKETCTRKLKRHNKGCLQFCKRILN